ncbi:aldehyde dehydrogenase family protein, partial [Microbacterium sp. B19]|uniref:aldehyde dehydrogenase family protein n=1 Tax=Microbacterium sp. B19 TaxID=96765 RepID=UPI0011D18F18
MTATTFDSLSPLDGRVVGTFPVRGADEVAATVDRARRAAEEWRALGFAGRRRALDGWRRDIVAHLDELIALVRAETGKPAGDARLEIMLALDHSL